jgi:ATP-dependent RNA helicase DHX8/PRP22
MNEDYLDEFRRSLPIYQFREDIVKVIKDNLYCIITGDTGSGKTTQLPQYIIESIKSFDLIIKVATDSFKTEEGNSNLKQSNELQISLDKIGKAQTYLHKKQNYSKKDIPKIVITQPRRVAAIQMAKRVAYERRCSLGKEVGYSIRFEDCSSDDTIIKFVTDGILVRECLADHNLSKYNVIILDEAHERSLYTDILFALCKQAVQKRNGDLRLIITSATLDTKQFSNYFNNCPVFQVQGRSHPVDIVYFNSRMEKRVENSVKLAIRIHLHEAPGHILSFLTGFEECEQACKLCYQKLEELATKGKNVPPMMIMPLYGAQNTDEQAMIFDKVPDNCRKLIFSTNIAETSLTVDGIGYVIDCGYVKQKIFNSKTSMDSLMIVPISKVQAVQRTGRAGRTGPGKCIRLYTEQFFESQMTKASIPEILRVNLASTILTLKSMGIDNVIDFDFMEKPEKESILDALKQLYYLQAIDQDGKITRLGNEMSKFPLDCTYSRCLIASYFYNIVDEMNTLVSLISCENVWFNVNKYDEERKALFDQKKLEFVDKFSDHMGFLNIYK